LDPLKSSATHFGALTGLKALGTQVARILVVPHVKAFVEGVLGERMAVVGNEEENVREDVRVREAEARKCFELVIVCII
jgi:prephenate dehydrogenase